MLTTYHIHISGLVQGVGFRPFVYNMAKDFKLAGWVNNTTDGVHLQFNSDEMVAQKFYKHIISGAPALAKITGHSIKRVTYEIYDSFKIVDSEVHAQQGLMLTPDFGICDDCKKELNDSNNRRYQYPFITCTQCGPRFSIIKELPYDRPNTSMNSFTMCEACCDEYTNPRDRRHYSQTNSCPNCAVTMEMFGASGNRLTGDNETIINEVIKELGAGKIIALKGVSGYLLLTDAGNKKSIKTLRGRKHRPSKPFALMFPNIELVKEIADLDSCEEEALNDVAAPIVLIKFKAVNKEYLCTNEIAPGLSRLGVMLPYTPLFQLVLQKFGKPLIATSANVSNASIIYSDDEALRLLPAIADFIVTNNREIILPQDDSVVQFTGLSKQKIIIRRSRGMAPSFFNYDCSSNETILATGALLKSSFTFVNNGNTFISQYLGSTESYEAQEAYSKTVQHFFELFKKKPHVILTDKHPLYFSNSFAKNLAAELKVETKEIQHHKAHFAAVLAENKLIECKTHQHFRVSPQKPILGVIWDGTGLGDDGNVWGGEFFTYENNNMLRYGHFDYFPFILGDKMAREPRISALSICSGAGIQDDFLKNKFTETEWNLYNKILRENSVAGGRLMCSSLGRVFDALASLLGICDKQSYEGEAAMLLQEQAQSYFDENSLNIKESYFKKDMDYHRIPTASMITEIAGDIRQKKSIQFIAAKFHYSLVRLVDMVAKNVESNKIVCSGGVFLNSLLVDLFLYHLSNRYELFFHIELSPNDENISFGQMVYYDNKIDEVNTKNEKKNIVEKIVEKEMILKFLALIVLMI
ncbi:MAG: carbamoyltransferase HypF [Ginsengibacter sp.]